MLRGQAVKVLLHINDTHVLRSQAVKVLLNIKYTQVLRGQAVITPGIHSSVGLV